MQATRVQHRVVFGGTRAIVLAAVAAAGVGIGYWVLPQEGSDQAAPTATAKPVVSPAERIVAAKIAQMDRADAALSPVSREQARADAIVAAKIAQMDRADAAFGRGSVAGVSTVSDEVGQSIGDRIWAVKFRQMEEQDNR